MIQKDERGERIPSPSSESDAADGMDEGMRHDIRDDEYDQMIR